MTWPVALDDDMKIWNEFDNLYWPADYVADRRGHLRYSHFGEGDYANTENVLREAARRSRHVASGDTHRERRRPPRGA